MKSQKLGVTSAVMASVCCVGPLLLAALGLGGLGLGAFIGDYHWYFITGAFAVLGVAWYAYLKERRHCATEQCEMVRGKLTRITLPLATLAVLVLFGLNLYTYAGDTGSSPGLVSAARAQTVIPVEGMTCYTCTVTVEHSLKNLKGVEEAHASVPGKSVTVSYDPQKVSVEQMVAAVNETGYRARLPGSS